MGGLEKGCFVATAATSFLCAYCAYIGSVYRSVLYSGLVPFMVSILVGGVGVLYNRLSYDAPVITI